MINRTQLVFFALLSLQVMNVCVFLDEKTELRKFSLPQLLVFYLCPLGACS